MDVTKTDIKQSTEELCKNLKLDYTDEEMKKCVNETWKEFHQKQCEICGKYFKPKSGSDKYCGILCLNASITDEEQQKAIKTLEDKGQQTCPICGRSKQFLIHKRMNGEWFLWQQYHYENNLKFIYTCYFCNLWEKEYRKRTGKLITPKEHKQLIKHGLKNKLAVI